MTSRTMAQKMQKQSANFRDWVAVLGGVLGGFMAILDIQITNASLRDIQGSLAASLDEGTWISTGYLVAEIVVIPLTAFLAEIFSFRLYLAGSALLFVGFSILCGLSQSLDQMILFRIGQGFTGGALIPAALTIVMTRLPERQRSIGLALFGMSATFAPAIGPTLGGWLTDTWSWHLIFYINVVPGLILTGAILYGIDRSPMNLARFWSGDWFGIIAMTIGLGALEIVLEEGERKDWFGNDMIRNCAVAAAIGLTAWIILGLTRKDPFINLRLLGNRSLAAGCFCALTMGIGLYGSIYLIPIYLGQIQGYNALQIGEVLMWLGLPQLVILPFVPRLMALVDGRILVGLGFSLFSASCYMNAFMTHDTAADQLHMSMLVRALGQPFIITPLSALTAGSMPPQHMGAASILFNIMRNLGGSIGIALLATFTTIREHFHFSELSERMGGNAMILQERISIMTKQMLPAAISPDIAQTKAITRIGNMVRREAYVMAYSDCFFIIGSALLISLISVALLRKPSKAVDLSGAH